MIYILNFSSFISRQLNFHFREHKLTDEEVAFVKKLAGGEFASHVDDTPEWEDLYSHEVELHPINRAPESKASFIPSKDEKNKVSFKFILIYLNKFCKTGHL